MPDKIKGLAVWLASDASSFVTQGRPLFARVVQGSGGTLMVDLGPPTPLRRDATSAIKKWRDCETRRSGCGNSQCLGPSSRRNRESIGR